MLIKIFLFKFLIKKNIVLKIKYLFRNLFYFKRFIKEKFSLLNILK
jgi:hypothetical protein